MVSNLCGPCSLQLEINRDSLLQASLASLPAFFNWSKIFNKNVSVKRDAHEVVGIQQAKRCDSNVFQHRLWLNVFVLQVLHCKCWVDTVTFPVTVTQQSPAAVSMDTYQIIIAPMMAKVHKHTRISAICTLEGRPLKQMRMSEHHLHCYSNV